jgi:nucleotide-binding universal stress UspA family protein
MKKILVGIDGSEKANEALDKAIELVEEMSSEIEIINVIEPLTFPVGMYPTVGMPQSPMWVTQYYDEYHKEHVKMMNEIYNKVKEEHPNLEVSKKVVEGLPASEIVKESNSGGFDLIVVGARGMGFVEELVLGSTSDIVVDKSEIPVLVVK